MAKIRSVEALDQAIDDEVTWRKQELTTALKLIQQSSGTIRRANIRSGVLILYAHWEGWIKSVARLYIRHVNTKSLPYNCLSDAFLGNALKTKMTEIETASKSLKHNEFAAFLRTDFSKSSALSEDLIRTDSNLSSAVFFDILTRLGLERRGEFILRANLIDAELVDRRNAIAQGEYLDIKIEEYTTLRNAVLDLLELFTDDVRNSASMGNYLASPSPQT